MIRLGKREEVEEYFERQGVSQSYLKKLIKGVQYLGTPEKKMHYEEKGNLLIGSGVDDKISMGDEAFERDYHIASDIKPSDTIKSMVHQVFDTIVDNTQKAPERALTAYSSEILTAVDDHNYQARWKEDTRINKVIETGFDYFKELKKAFGKTILSPVEKIVIDNIEISWRTSLVTAKYFVDSKDVHIFYQVPIYFELEGVSCKALLDMVVVNTKEHTVQVIDFKTMLDIVENFPYSAKSFRYDFQSAFYSQAMVALIMNNSTETIPELKTLIETGMTWKLMPFKFMVQSTKVKTDALTGVTSYFQKLPLVYTVSSETALIALHGAPEVELQVRDGDQHLRAFKKPTFRNVVGVLEAMDLHKWHLEYGFDHNKEVFENQGELML